MNQAKENFVELRAEEMSIISGGAEFSETVFRVIGWVVGGIGAIWSNWIDDLAELEERGIHPRI